MRQQCRILTRHFSGTIMHALLPKAYIRFAVRQRVRRRADKIAWALDNATPASATPDSMNGGRAERFSESAYQRASAPATNIIGIMNVTTSTIRRDSIFMNAFMTAP